MTCVTDGGRFQQQELDVETGQRGGGTQHSSTGCIQFALTSFTIEFGATHLTTNSLLVVGMVFASHCRTLGCNVRQLSQLIGD